MAVFGTYVLEVNWNGDGATFVDESANVQSVQVRRGRDYASALTGRVSAASFSAGMDNPAGRYASLNTASPLFGSILPGRLVRWRTTAPSAATLWAGYFDAIVPRPQRGVRPACEFRAVGPLAYVRERSQETAAFVSILGGAAVGKVLDDAGWPAGLRTIDAGQVTMAKWMADGVDSVAALHDVEDTEFGLIAESPAGNVVFEDVHHRLLPPHTVSQVTFSDASGAALPYSSLEQLDPLKDIFNRFTARVQLFTTQALAVLWAPTGETPAIGVGQTKDFWAVFPTPSSATQADHVSAWTTPVATTDYLVNSQPDGSGTDLTASVSVVATKFANTMKISLTNGAAVGGYVTFIRARGTAAYRNDPIEVSVDDSASATTYGKRTFPLPGKFFPTTVRALSFAQYGVSRYKDVLPTLALEIDATQSAAHMTQALARDVSDRVTVVGNATTQSGAQIGVNGDFYIESVTHRYSLGSHVVRYELSSVAGDGAYWTLGVSTLGVLTKLSP